MDFLQRHLDWFTLKRAPVYLVLVTPVSVALGLFLPRICLPLLNALLIFPVFLKFVRDQDRFRNILYMLSWALLLSVCVITATLYFPGSVQEKIINGGAYQEEMFQWVRSGVGPEGDIHLFLPLHLRHYGLFLLLSAVSGGFISLFMGAILLNYMNFYVGMLYARTVDPATVFLFGWPPWALLRVAGFIIAAVILAELAGSKLFGYARDKKAFIRYLGISLLFILLDITLKFFLAPLWQKALNDVIPR